MLDVWKKSVVLFGSNFMRVSVLLDMKSETYLLSLVVIAWKGEYFFIFLAKCFNTVCFRFSCMYFLTIRIALIKEQYCLYLTLFEVFPCYSFLPDCMLKRAGQLNGWVPMFHLECYQSKWKWNSSRTLSKRQIIEKVKAR